MMNERAIGKYIKIHIQIQTVCEISQLNSRSKRASAIPESQVRSNGRKNGKEQS